MRCRRRSSWEARSDSSSSSVRPRCSVAPNPPWIGGFTWEETEDGQPWVATSVQMDGADLWLPVKDHPSDKPDSVTIRITVPKPLVVASNGVLRTQHATADSTTFEWFTAQPISNYNIALNIAPYETIDTTYITVDGIELPATFWVLPERLDDGRVRIDPRSRFIGPNEGCPRSPASRRIVPSRL